MKPQGHFIAVNGNKADEVIINSPPKLRKDWRPSFYQKWTDLSLSGISYYIRKANRRNRHSVKFDFLTCYLK